MVILIVVTLALAIAFGLSVWSRQRNLQQVLAEKEQANAKLQERIETTKANLLTSEQRRHALEVSNAVAHERERMMREIHDGIGSGLVAALASAERQGKESSTAVVALKHALVDLRVAVDSLEPVEGDVTTLLASLRYRLEPEMRKSSIVFDWKVEEVPELKWLDAPNALHVMRIFQETFSNILGHAQATVIRVSCHLHLLKGKPGILVEVSDNGKGFDTNVAPKGHGRKNMVARAEALHADLAITSTQGKGSQVTLWLPLIRST